MKVKLSAKLGSELGNESVNLHLNEDETLTIEAICHGTHSTTVNINEWSYDKLISELEHFTNCLKELNN